jgi:hypothetical protein
MPVHQIPAPPAPKMNLPGLHENKGITYLSESENKPARPSMIEAVRGLKSEAAIHGFVSLRGGACRRYGAAASRTRDRMLLMDRALLCILEHAFARAAAPPWPTVSMFLRSLCSGCTVLHRRSTSCRNKGTNAKNKQAGPISSNMPHYTHVPPYAMHEVERNAPSTRNRSGWAPRAMGIARTRAKACSRMQHNARFMNYIRSLVFKRAAPINGNCPSERHTRTCKAASPSMARQLQACRTVPIYTWTHGSSGKSVISASPGDSVSGA